MSISRPASPWAIALLTGFLLLLQPIHPQRVAAVGWGDLFGAKVPVVLQHPPDLGFSVDRVAFAEAEGECSAEFVALLTQDFLHHQVEIIERAKIERIMEEIDFSASGYIQPDHVQPLGEFMGASALIFVEVVRCTTQKNRSHYTQRTDQGSVTTYSSKTTVHFKSSIRIVDTLTGRIHSAKVVEETREDTDRSTEGYPAYPDGFVLKDAALRGGVVKVHRMLLPWREVLQLRFFKTGKCGMEDAFHAVEIQDYEGALERALAAVEVCRTLRKPKLLSRALYNVGVVHLLRRDHDEALESFREAYSVRPGDAMQEGVNLTRKAIRLTREMETFRAADADRLAGVVPGAALGPVAQGAPDPTADAGREAEERSVAERLEELARLRDEGLISEEEFQTLREQILSSL